MTEYQFKNIWKEKDQDTLDKIVEAWENVSAIPKGQNALDRAKNVVYLVENNQGKIIGLSTAEIAFIPHLENHLFYYRCLIFPGKRIPGLLASLSEQTINYLESIHKELSERVIGVITEIENKNLKKLNRAKLHTGLVFAGYSKRDNPIRVYYFKGARIN